MKTVEERMVVLDTWASDQNYRGTVWANVRDQVAQQLTQQAAEWLIAVNEASAIGSREIRQAQDEAKKCKAEVNEKQATIVSLNKTLGTLAAQLNSYREELAKARGETKQVCDAALAEARKCEAVRTEAAVREAYEHAARILEGDERYNAAALVRGLIKAPSPVSEPGPKHCWQTDGPREVNSWNDLSKRSESDWQHPWNQWPPSVVAPNALTAAQSQPAEMDPHVLALQLLMLPGLEDSKLRKELNDRIFAYAILRLGGKLPVDEVK